MSTDRVLPQHDPGLMAALVAAQHLIGSDITDADTLTELLDAIDAGRAAEGWVPPWMRQETSVLVVDDGETCWHGPTEDCPRTDHKELPLYAVR